MAKVYFMKLGNCLNADLDFKKELKIQMNLPVHEVSSEIESDVIIAFVPIVSRAGTDIEAALKKIPENRPVVLVVLHYTFDPYFVAPVSRLSVNRSTVFTVDCLFHEDRGLMRCERNNEALSAVKEYLEKRSSSSELPGFQILQYAWKMITIILIFMTIELLHAIFFVVLFLLMLHLDKFFRVKCFTSIFVACFLIVIFYIYDIEELILPSLELADTEQKAETIHSIKQIFHQNISQNISQNINQTISKTMDQNITEKISA